jgi:uncharacterized membrane protein
MFIDRLIKPDPSLKRHVAKTITWRIIGTLDTMALGWFITGNPMTGIKIGGVEVITKMVLYFLHERTWFRINYGLPHRKDSPKTEVNAVKPEVIIIPGESTRA